jgi:uncharacterized damage-inducible protein DinB
VNKPGTIQPKDSRMNSILENYYPLFRYYQSLRNQLLDLLTDADLAFRPSPETFSLGALCVEIGETQKSYIDSFTAQTQDFSYRNQEAGLSSSLERLRAWYSNLDQELEQTITAIPEDEIENRRIDRGHNFVVSPQSQLDIYKEALIIFYGKVSIYLKLMKITPSEHWQEWIA